MSRRAAAVAAQQKTKDELDATAGAVEVDEEEEDDGDFHATEADASKSTKRKAHAISSKRGAGGGICLSDEEEDEGTEEAGKEASAGSSSVSQVSQEAQHVPVAKKENTEVAAPQLSCEKDGGKADSKEAVSMSKSSNQSMGALLARMNRPRKKTNKKAKKMDKALASLLADDPVDASAKELASKAAKAALAMAGKMEVEEKVRFAGQSISVVRSVDKSSKEAQAALTEAQTTQGQSALDQIVDELKNPTKAISAVAKSSYDWDKFKHDQGLTEQLANASKDGYVEKQAFLHRVDARTFEVERAERDKARAMAALHAPKPK